MVTPPLYLDDDYGADIHPETRHSSPKFLDIARRVMDGRAIAPLRYEV